MVGLINFYFSSGMLALFIDAPLDDSDDSLPPLTNPLQKTFRGDQEPMVTQADAWAVIFCSFKNTLLTIFLN